MASMKDGALPPAVLALAAGWISDRMTAQGDGMRSGAEDFCTGSP
jgi:hypothetical protein